MRAGFIVSGIAHVALIAWGFLSLHSTPPLDTSSIEQIPVDFVTFAGTEADSAAATPTATASTAGATGARA
jgi:hypothetical protein